MTATATDHVIVPPFNPDEAFNAAPATTTTAVVPVDVEALERLTDDERVDALCKAWGQWRRLETVAAWSFGRALRANPPRVPPEQVGRDSRSDRNRALKGSPAHAAGRRR